MALALAVALYIYTSPLLENVFRRLLSCQNFAQRNPRTTILAKYLIVYVLFSQCMNNSVV